MQDIGTQFHIRCNKGDVGRYVFFPEIPDVAKASPLILTIPFTWE